MISKQKKFKLFDLWSSYLYDSTALVVVNYCGLDVAELTDLRIKLRSVDTHLTIVKSRVFKKVLSEDKFSEYQCMISDFQGPVAAVYVGKDLVAALKVIFEFAKENENLTVKAGYYDKAKFAADELEKISKLPAKEVLYAKIVGSLIGVHRGLLHSLCGVQRDLVAVLSAIRDTKK